MKSILKVVRVGACAVVVSAGAIAGGIITKNVFDIFLKPVVEPVEDKS